jgi:hypothetical protein
MRIGADETGKQAGVTPRSRGEQAEPWARRPPSVNRKHRVMGLARQRRLRGKTPAIGEDGTALKLANLCAIWCALLSRGSPPTSAMYPPIAPPLPCTFSPLSGYGSIPPLRHSALVPRAASTLPSLAIRPARSTPPAPALCRPLLPAPRHHRCSWPRIRTHAPNALSMHPQTAPFIHALASAHPLNYSGALYPFG